MACVNSLVKTQLSRLRIVTNDHCLEQYTIAESDRLSDIAQFDGLSRSFDSVSFEELDEALWLGALPSSHRLCAWTGKHTIIHALEKKMKILGTEWSSKVHEWVDGWVHA